MNRDSKIIVTGAHGMVGGALSRLLSEKAYRALLTPSRAELDLTDPEAVLRFFEAHRPEYVFMIAARVGGIAANIADPVGFIAENVRIAVNLFEASAKVAAKKCLFLGSSCIYPRESPQPMREEYLMTGPLEPTNEGYALSKIVGLKLAKAYENQYGLSTVCPMPPNVYGTGDHFDFEKSHVLAALVRRFVEAVDDQLDSVTLWGTGVARREFLHVEDLADAMLVLMETWEGADLINIGPGTDVSIRELAGMIAEATGYEGEILWDDSKPDGMPQKCLDVSKAKPLGWRPRIALQEGIRMTIQEFRSRVAARNPVVEAAVRAESP